MTSKILPTTRKVKPSQIIVFREENKLNDSVIAIYNQLKELFQNNEEFLICYKNGYQLQNGGWQKDTVAIFFGYGHCPTWDRELGHDIGQKAIHDFVMNYGGFVAGFCAGGYYLSAISQFGKWPPKDRQVNLFPGKAIGPLFPIKTFSPCDIENARALKIAFGNQIGLVHYLSGCHFVPDKNATGILDTISYLDSGPENKVAAALTKVGKGFSFVAGFHIEFSFVEAVENSNNAHFNHMVRTLKPYESFRKSIWDFLVQIIKKSSQNKIYINKK